MSERLCGLGPETFEGHLEQRYEECVTANRAFHNQRRVAHAISLGRTSDRGLANIVKVDVAALDQFFEVVSNDVGVDVAVDG